MGDGDGNHERENRPSGRKAMCSPRLRSFALKGEASEVACRFDDADGDFQQPQAQGVKLGPGQIARCRNGSPIFGE